MSLNFSLLRSLLSHYSLPLPRQRYSVQYFLPWLHIRSIYGAYWSPTHGDSDSTSLSWCLCSMVDSKPMRSEPGLSELPAFSSMGHILLLAIPLLAWMTFFYGFTQLTHIMLCWDDSPRQTVLPGLGYLSGLPCLILLIFGCIAPCLSFSCTKLGVLENRPLYPENPDQYTA